MKDSVLHILVTKSTGETLDLTSAKFISGSKEDFINSVSESFTKGASLVTELINDIRKENLIPSIVAELKKEGETKDSNVEKLILLPFYLYLTAQDIKIKEFFILYEGVIYPLDIEIPKHFIENSVDSFLCLPDTLS